MKIRYLFSFAALAFIMAACSSDENTYETLGKNGQKMPFTATISVDQATTRSLSETTDGSAITASWKKDEQVALIHNGQIDVMSVTAVSEDTKVATIKGDITSPTDGEAVTVVYPASAVDQETKAVKADLLKSQDGSLATISGKLDYCTAETTLAVSEGGSTFGSAVTLALQHAIWKLSLTDGSNDINASKLVVKDGNNIVLTTVTPATATNSLYIAMAPASSADMNFEATVGDDTYTYSKTGITLKAGKYYVSTMAMNAPEPGKMTVSATGYEATYDGQAHGITVSVTEPATGATIKYGEKEGEYNLDESPTYTDAGKHTVYYQVTMDKYETVTGSADVEITQAAATISIKEATVTITYGDAAPTNALTNTGDGTVTYASSNTAVAEVNKSTGALTITGTGEATITATVTDGTNYSYATKEVSYKLTVNAKTMTVSATGYKATYDGQAYGITVSVTEPATGATIKYGEKEGEYNLTSNPTYTDAGKHTVYYQVTMDKYETVTGSADVEITQAAATISIKEATVTINYGDAAPTNALTNTGDGTVTYASSNTAVAEVNKSTGALTITGVGETTIKATVTDGTNYSYATKEVSYTLTVKVVPISISKPDNYDNGGSNPF
jgi:hypothetical protein